MENKLIKVLGHFLSLHEADEIFEALFDENVDVEDVQKMLDKYKTDYENEDNVIVEELDDEYHLYNSSGQCVEGDFSTSEEAIEYAKNNGYNVVDEFNRRK